MWRKKILNYNTIYIKTINQGILRHVSSWKASLPHAFYQEAIGEWDQPKRGEKVRKMKTVRNNIVGNRQRQDGEEKTKDNSYAAYLESNQLP